MQKHLKGPFASCMTRQSSIPSGGISQQPATESFQRIATEPRVLGEGGNCSNSTARHKERTLGSSRGEQHKPRLYFGVSVGFKWRARYSFLLLFTSENNCSLSTPDHREWRDTQRHLTQRTTHKLPMPAQQSRALLDSSQGPERAVTEIRHARNWSIKIKTAALREPAIHQQGGMLQHQAAGRAAPKCHSPKRGMGKGTAVSRRHVGTGRGRSSNPAAAAFDQRLSLPHSRGKMTNPTATHRQPRGCAQPGRSERPCPARGRHTVLTGHAGTALRGRAIAGGDAWEQSWAGPAFLASGSRVTAGCWKETNVCNWPRREAAAPAGRSESRRCSAGGAQPRTAQHGSAPLGPEARRAPPTATRGHRAGGSYLRAAAAPQPPLPAATAAAAGGG